LWADVVGGIISAVDWRRLGERVLIVVTVAGVTWVAVWGVVALVRGPANGDPPPHAGKLFDACVAKARFLVLVRHRSKSEAIEKIKDRARDAVVGEFTVFPSARAAMSGPGSGFRVTGTDSQDGRYDLTTVSVFGHDATTVENCWNRLFPLAPGAG
jgi:hypothetical protein